LQHIGPRSRLPVARSSEHAVRRGCQLERDGGPISRQYRPPARQNHVANGPPQCVSLRCEPLRCVMVCACRPLQANPPRTTYATYLPCVPAHYRLQPNCMAQSHWQSTWSYPHEGRHVCFKKKEKRGEGALETYLKRTVCCRAICVPRLHPRTPSRWTPDLDLSG